MFFLFFFFFISVFILCHVNSHNRFHQSVPQDHGRGAVHRVHVAPMAATTFIQTLVGVFEAQELVFSLARVPWPGFEPGSFTTSSYSGFWITLVLLALFSIA